MKSELSASVGQFVAAFREYDVVVCCMKAVAISTVTKRVSIHRFVSHEAV
jgi:hypothetical protein